MNDILRKCESELSHAITAIQQPRTNFQLAHFVVGQHDTEARCWHQCVLELQIKLGALKRAEIGSRQVARKIAALEACGDIEADDEAALLRLDLEDHERAVLGAEREAQALYAIFLSFPRGYSREELDAAEEEYWRKRLTRQARQEINATGTIGVGNQDALEQIGISPGPLLAEAKECLNSQNQSTYSTDTTAATATANVCLNSQSREYSERSSILRLPSPGMSSPDCAT